MDPELDDPSSSLRRVQDPIAELRRAEEELRRANESLSLAQRAGDAGVWDWNIAAASAAFVSPEYRELYGLAADAPMSLERWLELVHPADRERAAAAARGLFERGSDWWIEYRILHPTRGLRWLRGVGKLERDAQGRPARFSGINIDVTAQKHAEQRLRETEDRLRFLVEAASQAVWETDAGGQAVEDSPSWRACTGQTVEEWLGEGWADAVHPDDRENAVRQWREAVAEGRSVDVEFRLRVSGGGYRWTNARAVPFRGADGEVLKYVGMNLDVHDRKLAEEALKEADRRKNEFLATLAHELRNPLAPLQYGLSLLELDGGDLEAAARTREMMQRQLAHLVRLVDDLLDVSRISRGKVELRRERLDLRRVVSEGVEVVRPLCVERGHELVVSLPEAPVPLYGDADRLTQVVGNLVSNACKFTAPGGRIEVRVERDAGEAAVVVKDDGVGIPPEHLSRVFELFSQVDAPGSRAAGGLGIGLSLVRQLVELHGGTVEASSEGPGRGSEFLLHLPALPVEAAPAGGEKVGGGVTSPGRLRVLVVDDNRDAAVAAARLLRADGHEVDVAHDGDEALRAAEARPPDAALLDIGLPGRDGYSVCRELRARSGGEPLFLVAVTGWGQDEDRRRALDAGFDLHLTKPVDLRALRQALNQQSSSRP